MSKKEIIEKLTYLKEKVSIFNFHSNITDDKDLIWCQRLLSDAKDDDVIPSKEEFIMANLIWKKYDGLPTDRKSTEENMWKLIDSILKQENPSKIQAIKMYRRFVDSTLREAKEMIDAREIVIQKGW